MRRVFENVKLNGKILENANLHEKSYRTREVIWEEF